MAATWYELDPLRLQFEKEQLEPLGFSLLTDELQRETVAFIGPSEIPGVRFRVEYPRGFPSIHPQIRIVDGYVPSMRHVRLDGHEVCVFGFPNETHWTAKLTGADAVRQANTVLALNEVETPEPVTDIFSYSKLGTILVPHILAPPKPGLKGSIQFGELAGTTVISAPRFVVTELLLPGAHPVKHTLLGELGAMNSTRKAGKCVFLESAPRSREELLRRLRELNLIKARNPNRHSELVLAFFDEQSQRGSRVGAIGVFRNGNSFEYLRAFVVAPEEFEDRIGAVSSLKGREVLIVGAGSLGSQISSMLAQSNLGKLSLVDDDILKPGNLVRFSGLLGFSGLPKVDATDYLIRQINPFCQVTKRVCRVGSGTKDDEIAVTEMLSSADLIIETTGSHMVRRYLNEKTFGLGKTVIYSWVTSGVWGGEAIRVNPKETPCYLCYRFTHVHSANSSNEESAFVAGCSQPTFVGTSFDELAISSSIVRLAVSTLINDPLKYPIMSGMQFIWNLRNPEGMATLEASGNAFTRDLPCPVCGDEI